MLEWKTFVVEEKYCRPNKDDQQQEQQKGPWIFVLKNYTQDKKFINQHIAKSLNSMKHILNGLAASISGKCVENFHHQNGQEQQLVVYHNFNKKY